MNIGTTADANLLPLPGSCGWTTETPSHKSIASFCAGDADQSLRIQLSSDAYGLGKWIAEIPAGPGWYDFSADCRSSAGEHEVYVLLTVLRADGSMITREHAQNAEKTPNGWRFTDKTEVPADGGSIRVELWLRGYRGYAVWQNPTLVPGDAPVPRKVTIALGYMRTTPPATLEHNLKKMMGIVDKCGAAHPDVIVLGEGMVERGSSVPLEERAETEEGATVTAMRKKAAQYGTYLLYNFHEREGTEIYNTSLLLDRQGRTVGKYRKTHLTVTELEQGMTPGWEHPVFETDFGRVGMLTCFDQYFAAPAREIIDRGAELLLIPSAGDAAEKTHARAMDGGIFVAVCGMNKENIYGWEPARIVDPNGKIIAESGEDGVPVICTVDLSQRFRRFWMSTGPAQADVHGVFRFERNPLYP